MAQMLNVGKTFHTYSVIDIALYFHTEQSHCSLNFTSVLINNHHKQKAMFVI